MLFCRLPAPWGSKAPGYSEQKKAADEIRQAEESLEIMKVHPTLSLSASFVILLMNCRPWITKP